MSDPLIKAPKGTRDLTGPEVRAFTRLETVAREVFDSYRFEEIRTPVFESVELFSRSLGETSDVVEKEMFVFTDRGERTFALRPEGTAGVVRSFIENNRASQGGTHRFFYAGPMFRAERPQAGRYRQFWQIGSEHFGQTEASADADTVLMIEAILVRFGVTNFSIQVNSLGCKDCRARHREALLAYLRSKEHLLSEESRRRMTVNPLRVLDSKADGPQLTDAPAIKDYLCESCAAHHREFLSLVRSATSRIEENSRLVRGLDYYTRTVFEFVSPDLGAQSALAAGGRYDELVESLGGPSVPGVGFALGMDRLVSALMKAAPASIEPAANPSLVFVIPLSDAATAAAFGVAVLLRRAGWLVPPILSKKKLKNQLSLAAEQGAAWAVLIGDDEMRDHQATVKNLSTREQTRVDESRLAEHLKR